MSLRPETFADFFANLDSLLQDEDSDNEAEPDMENVEMLKQRLSKRKRCASFQLPRPTLG